MLTVQRCAAIDRNDANAVRALLEDDGADPSEPSEQFPTSSPLLLAAYEG